MELSSSKIRKFFIFQEMKFLSSKIKKFLASYFSYILGLENFLSSKNKKANSEEISYISGNGTF